MIIIWNLIVFIAPTFSCSMQLKLLRTGANVNDALYLLTYLLSV